jgi:serine/threonine protein kinase
LISSRYTLEREIGRGGAGTVHLARDEVLGRTVAIKRIGLMPGTTNPDLARAEREARIAAALNHPHVVSVFDLVEEDDCHWLVMEYVDGRTLAEVVREEGPLEPTRAAGILAQTADALVEAHSAGIVHRDVKPSNILVNAEDHAKLGDFGIARASTDPSLTQTGLVTGSPAYLAPEVASGSAATTASDVWSLGATLYHALAGRPPYDVGENLIGALYKIVHDDPPRLPIDHPMAGLLAVTMVKEPDQRWSMEQVRDELGRLSRGERGRAPAPGPVAAPNQTDATAVITAPTRTTAEPAPAAERTPRPAPTPAAARRRGLPMGWIAAAAAVVLVAVLAVWLWPGDGDRPSAGSSGGGASEQPTTQPSQTQETEPAEDASDTPEETQAAMDAFVSDYLSLVTSDPESAFSMLAPQFKQASGGYDGYMGWWGTVRSATPTSIESNPSDLTVGYTVDYVMKSGRRETQQVRLELARQGDGFVIAGEG